MSECFWKHNSLNESGTEDQLVNGYISTFLRIALSKSAVVLIYEVLYLLFSQSFTKFLPYRSYSVLDANPWRETSKLVYVLTQRENQLGTRKTRRNHRFKLF
ncbi:hypothetical protein Peur_005997 [Populus x canadensis]